MKIRSFTGNDTYSLDHEINKFLTQNGETVKVRDIKITAVTQPAGMFFDNRGFATETMYTYVVLYD